MNLSNCAGETVFSAASPYISKKLNTTSILISTGLVLLSAFSFYLGMQCDASSDSLSMLLFTLGSIMVLVAIYRFFWKSQMFIYTATKSSVKENSCYFDSCDLSFLQELLKKGKFEGENKLSFKQNGNIRMDYMYSKDRRFVAVQLFQFVPYAYSPASSVYFFEEEKAASFARYFKTT